MTSMSVLDCGCPVQLPPCCPPGLRCSGGANSSATLPLLQQRVGGDRPTSTSPDRGIPAAATRGGLCHHGEGEVGVQVLLPPCCSEPPHPSPGVCPCFILVFTTTWNVFQDVLTCSPMALAATEFKSPNRSWRASNPDRKTSSVPSAGPVHSWVPPAPRACRAQGNTRARRRARLHFQPCAAWEARCLSWWEFPGEGFLLPAE